MSFLVQRPTTGLDDESALDTAIAQLRSGTGYPCVHAVWEDPSGENEWSSLPNHIEERAVKLVESIAWLIHADDHSVTIAGHLSHRGELESEADDYFGGVNIPRSCLVSMALLA